MKTLDFELAMPMKAVSKFTITAKIFQEHVFREPTKQPIHSTLPRQQNIFGVQGCGENHRKLFDEAFLSLVNFRWSAILIVCLS